MLTLISFRTIKTYPDLFYSLFELRHREFIDRQHYDVKSVDSMEFDQYDTKLDWVAVDHYNTGHPHTHIIVRGRDDRGQDLVIAKEYISQGFRERAQAQVTLDLGPRSDLEINTHLRDEVGKASLTSIDRQLLREARETGQVSGGHRDPQMSAFRTGRLNRLADMGLAEAVGQGHWRLHENMEATLRQMGERGDIIKTLHREMKRRGMTHAVADSVIHDQAAAPGAGVKPITGRLLSRGLADEANDRHYLMVEGTDSRVHYVDIGQGDRIAPIPREAIVRLEPKVPDLRPSDRTIIQVAEANGGYYDVQAHLKHDRNARQDFAETHMRRLEAIRRSTAGVEREPDGRFRIGAGYAEKALQYEQKEAHRSPMQVEVLSTRSLDVQTRRAGVSWLDRELTAGRQESYAGVGFGHEVQQALRQRQQWLIAEGLGERTAEGIFLPADGLIQKLRQRELVTVGADLARELGRPFGTVEEGQRIEGRLRQKVMIGDEAYGVVERARDFALVPWKPVLEKHIDKAISGMARDAGISWKISRQQSLEIE